MFKRIAGIVLAAAFILAAMAFPGNEALSHEAAMALGVLFAAVALWFCNTMPQGVTGLLAIVLLVLFGVQPSISGALSGFTAATTWFILCVFCMTAIMQTSSLGARLTAVLLGWAGCDSRKLVFALMAGTAFVSFFMTDTGAVVIGMSMALPVLRALGAKPGNSNLGKCLMLGIAFSGVLGGFALPCGHALNVLGIGIMEQTIGQTIGFVAWMFIGLPVCMVMLPIMWFLLVHAFPPEDIGERWDASQVAAPGEGGQEWTARDKKALFVVVLLPALWIAGNWVSFLDTTVVAMLGVVLLFLPGMDLMTWKKFQDIAGWNVFVFVGSIMSLGDAVSATGGTDFIANLFLQSGILGVHPLLVLLIVGLALYLIQTFCPVAPVLAMLFLPPLLAWAQSAGITPAAPVFLVASITAGSFLVPLNPSMALTYEQGFYKFGEVAKAGWLGSIVYVALVAGWTYFVCVVLGAVGTYPV